MSSKQISTYIDNYIFNLIDTTMNKIKTLEQNSSLVIALVVLAYLVIIAMLVINHLKF